MEIHQLQYIVEVDKQRSFTKAADEMFVSQSTLSHQIAKLENELGVKLFDRNSRTVYPTQIGEEFINHAKQILANLEVAKQNIQSHIGLLKGTLRIGVIASLGKIDYAGMLANFHRKHPGLNYEIVQSGTYNLLDKLKAGEIDVSFITLLPLPECDDLQFHYLAYDEYVLAVPPGHPFAGRDYIELAEAADEKFIFHPSSERMYHICMEACAQAGFKPNIVCQGNHSPTCLSLISAGMGIGFFPYEKIEAQKFEIGVVKLKEPVRKDIALVIGKYTSMTPAVTIFCRFVLHWADQLRSKKT